MDAWQALYLRLR